MAQFKLHKKMESGQTVYRQVGSTISLKMGKDMFEGDPPAEFTLDVPNIHKPWLLDAEQKRAEREAKAKAKAEAREAKKAERAKALEAKKAEVEAKKAAKKAEQASM